MCARRAQRRPKSDIELILQTENPEAEVDRKVYSADQEAPPFA